VNQIVDLNLSKQFVSGRGGGQVRKDPGNSFILLREVVMVDPTLEVDVTGEIGVANGSRFPILLREVVIIEPMCPQLMETI
jgi:hypothetical protein